MSLIIDVISRKTTVKQTLINPGDVTLVIYEPSVVQVHAPASAVVRYVHEGNDLLIYMQDGTVIRCNGYFLQATNTTEPSELVFADGQQLTHVAFADAASGGLAPVELTAQTTAIESIAPFLDTVGQTSAFPWGWLAAAAVGGGGLGALLASGGGDSSKTEVINNTPPSEPGNATPSFLVTDNQGEQRGILSANDITDDTTPTFSGTGQAEATIQIKDSNGNTIASTQVDSKGHWSVSLPTQSAGEHTWSVVQIVGNTTTDAGSITLTIDNSQAAVQFATTAGDNIINASEQAAGFTLSGASSHLAQGTELTVTLNDKTYTATVGANGTWRVQVPTADAQALSEGNQVVLVSGKDATGNTVTGAQRLTVDTQPPTLTINAIAQDNIINAAEHNVALVLSGTSNAETGQIVTLTLNGTVHTATVGHNGGWQVTLPASDVQALADGRYTLNASVSDRAGNMTSDSANFTVDTHVPTISVNTVAGDDILNNAEQAVAQIISGRVSGAFPGDTVTVKLGTGVLTGVVLADGTWNVALDPALTRTLDRGVNTIIVSVTDAAGNMGTATHNISLVGVAPLITINTVSGDDVINAAEKGAPLTLTGSTQQVEAGQTVTVTLAGQNFTTTVQSDGSWSVTVPASAVGNLPDGAVAITASVTDASGNTGDTSRTITVDSQAPALSIDPLTADNIINASESGQNLQISGTTDAQPGQTVTVTLNGQTYQGTVQPDGTWSVSVPAANVGALADGNATVTASVTDVAGNPSSISRVALVDTTPPVVTINPVATDNVINTPEHAQAQIISGTVTGAQAGDIVTVTLNNVNYTTVVDVSGNWSLGVPASVVSGLADGSYPVSVSVTDRAGNTGSQSLTVTVDTAAPVIGINTIAGDDVINASEKGADVQITGTSDQPANTAITVTLNGQNYTTTTDASGNWSITVPASAVTALGQANYTVTAAVTSDIGNSATASHNVLVDSALPGVTINSVATDDIINAAEAGVAQTISGQVTGAAVGDTVTVTLGGNTYTTTVQAGLSWCVSVPATDIQALGNGDLTVNASVTNQNGNTGSGTRDITIDANLPGLRVDTVAGDDVVNIIEHGQALVVTGSSSGLAEGTPLTVTINNVEYTTAVQADGSWSVGVTAAQVSAWPAGALNITVSGADGAGNPVSITHPVTVDLTPAAITINTIATDDVINAVEKGADLTLSGTTTNVEAGQTVTVTFGGKNYTATVASDGSWTATVPAADLALLTDGSASAQASVSNINGNSASAVHNYSVDSSAPTIIINTVAGDNIVNASEADAGVTVSGTTTAEAGQIVTITLNSPTVQTYQATVQADGSWSVNIPAADLAALADGSHTLTATVNDKAGNPASTTHNLAVDLTVPVLTINTIAGDDIINATEHGQALVISGSSTGGEAGDVVTVTLNSKTYTTTLDASGNWSVGVPAADVTALGSGPQIVTATVTDAAGNSDSETHTVTVNLTAPTVGINTIATDDVINATEKGADLQISGTSNQPAGTTITVTLNGQNYTATMDAAGNWSTTVPASAVGALGEASYTVTANVTDSAGNSNSSSHNVQVNTALPGVTINPVATDDIINAAESGVAQTISGQVTGAAAGDTVTVTLGGKTYTATVQGNLSWSVNVPATDLSGLTASSYTVTATVSDKAGNLASADHALAVDVIAPDLTINTVAGDDIINAIEHGQALVITGTSTGAEPGDVVTVTLNGKNYTTTLDDSGNWSVGIPAADVTALATGSQTITASLSDRAGNSDSTTHYVTVDLSCPTLTINTVSGDDIINNAEKTQDLTISGGSSGLATGTTVTVMLNGLAYSATTDGSGNWSVTVPASAVGTLGEAVYSISASATDSAGNSGSTTHTVNVESLLPGGIINTVAGDDIINAAEIAVNQTISGQVTGTAEAGNTVTVTLGGNQYTATVQPDLSWSVSVPAADLQALGNGELTISASVTNSANNTGTTTHAIVIDANLPGLRVDTVAGDDVVNSIEHSQALVITGSSSGLTAGTPLTVVINNVTYGATVLADGTWSVGISAEDVSNWPAGTINIAVSGTNTAGTTTSISHPVTVDLAAVAITINTLSGDDVINAAEKGSDLQLSGTTSGVEAGQTITVIFGGKSYTTTVATGGSWGLTVPAADLATLPDGAANVQASVSNVAGNNAQATHAYSVDASAPTITINTIASDDILNAAEAGSALTISGTSTAEAGQTVTVTLNGVSYSGNVQADGSWSVSVPTGDLANLTASSYTVNAAVSDKAGNPASATHNLTVDLAAPVVTINTVAGDDIINATEHGQAQIISGSATGATTGNTVSVTIGTSTYTTMLDANGNWSIGVPASVISALAQGNVTITATVSDSAGNSGTASHMVTVALGAPILGINTIAVDDIINATEKGADLAISGSSNQPAGTLVTVTLNGQNYTTTADVSGNWSVTVPASAVSALGEATYTVTASATDVDGNSGSASHNVQVNTALPGITINVVASDDIINAAEAGATQTISGQVTRAAAGDTVTVTLGGATYTATVQADLSWSVDVPAPALQALGNGELTISASVTNSVGNTGNGTREITIDANLPGLRIDTVAGDDVVNIIEHGQALVITGSSADLAVGSDVTLTINGQTYVAAVLADGTWSIGVPAADVSAWPAGTVTITASGTSNAGNPVSVTHPVTVDLTAVAVSINAITADDVINSAEKSAALTLSGSTSGVEAGQTVTVTFGGKTYTANVAANGSWSTTVPTADMAALRDGDASAQASVSNVNGNSATTTHAYSVDASAPTVTINTIAGDDILNAAEAGTALTINGSSTAEAGQTVTVTLNGANYTGTVQTDGSWSVSVPPADLSALTASNYTVSAAVSDKAGNPASVNHNLTVDTSVPVVTINTVAGDDVINATEHAQAQIISGSATGAATGSTVTVTIGTNTFTTVLDASGNWSVGVPASVVSALANGTVTINASVTDAAGNSGSATHQVTVNTGLPTITFNAISGDNVLNADEKGQPLTISGSSTGLATGAQVTVTLNGHNYSATTDAAGNWTLTVPVSDLAALGQVNYTVSASATSAAGNTASSQANLLVDSGLPGVTINTVAGDDIINAAEAGTAQTISGVVTRAAAGDTVTVTLGGKTYTTTVQDNLSWSVSVPAADLQALGNGDLTINASVTNANGNTGSGTRDITIDANLPGLRVDTVAGDDIVNSIEHGQALVITGGSSGLNAGAALTVTINGVAYAATVQADGSWSVGIPAANVSAWPAGPLTVEVAGQSSAGNPVSVSHPFTVDLTAVAISINTVASDDVINAAEKGADLTLSGSTSGIESGQTVTVTFGGKTYTTSVAANGSWSVNVPAGDLATLPDGAANVQASVSSASGNSASATHAYSVDASAPTLTINTIASDDILNATEAGSPLTISGTSTAEIGQTVTVTLNGTTYTGNVQADGSWSVSVPTSALGALTASNYTVSATVNDKAGNPGSASHNLAVDTTAPVISINTIAGDDVINATEKGANLALSGTSDQPAGTAITVTLNGQNYSATTDASGNWSVTVPASAVSALGEATYSVTASVTNAQGNSSTASYNVQVNTALPGVTINPVATDDIINASEAGSAQTISGQVTGAAAGSTVTVELGGKTYTATVQPDLSWNVSVPAADWQALGNGELTVNASVTNAVGNTGSGTRDITIDASLPGLRVDTVAGDDVVNIIEHAQAQVITGSSSGFAAGTALTVVINNQTYAATVLANGTWSVGVPAADVSNWPAGTLNITVSGVNTAGTQTSITHPVTIDLTAVAISINNITSDDVINAAEKGAALTLSGSTSGVEAGQTVSIIFGGKTYTTTVAANGSWSTTVPAADMATLRDGDASAQVRVTNVNGNSATAVHEYSVDSAAPTVIINTIASDNIINASEAAAGVTVSGTSTAETGQTLTITLNGSNYQTTVQADGSWALTLPASVLTALANNSYTLTATVSDLAGNPGSASKGVTVDTTAPVISFNTVAGDDVINNVEHTQAQIISGTATGAVAGDRLVVTIAGQQYVTSTDASGNWSVGVPASVISGLADGTVTLSATITDSAGNSSTQTHNVQVNTAVVSLSVSTISGDNLINAAEAGSALTLSGTGTNFATGTVVTVLLNGKGYSATIQSNGSWSVNVPAADVAALADGTSYTVSASAQDSAGNSATASRSVAVDLTAPIISINTVSTDDRLNAAEQQQPLTLSGSTSAEVGQTVTVTFGGKTYTATVAANGTWALNVPAADLATLGQGAQAITASVNDRAGNPGQATHTLTVDTVAPTVTIATVAGDDIINSVEQAAGQTISGTTTAEAGQIVTVTFNGQTWTATVGSGGAWSVFIPGQQFSGLSNGSYTIGATVTDLAGNPGSATHNVTLNGDVPTVTINTFAGDDIVNAAEHSIPLTISGTTTAPAGQTVTLTLNDKTYTTTVQTGGSWSYTVGSADIGALADGGAYVINAQVSNAIGNTGSSNHTITVDLSAPTMGINIDSLQADTGLSATDFITSVSPVVVNGSLTAALAANASAQISLDGGVTWTTLTVTGTTWRYNDSRTLTDGNYVYQVRVIDNAGNVGATASQNVVIDTVAPNPAVKTIAITAINTDTGLFGNDFITSDTTLAVSGSLGATLATGEFAQISIDGGTTWQNVAVSGLSWTFIDGRTLSDGNYNYMVRVVDLAGNVGATASQIVTVDTTAPLASKTITIAGISDDTGLSSGDFVTRDTTLTVRGTLGAALAADERAQISLDGGVTWTTLTVIGTNWSYADGRTLTDGTWNYTVRVVDLAGNVGQTATQNVVVDTTPPAASETISITGISDDTGFSSSDFITNDTSLTVRGVLGAALGANEFAQISVDNGATWTTLSTSGTQWTYVDGRTLTDGSYVYQVRVVDAAGNIGPVVAKTVVIDTINPTAMPTIVSYTDDVGQRQGTLSNSLATDDTSPAINGVLSGPLASGEVVYLYRNGILLGAVTMVGALNWTYSDSGLVSGAYTYSARVVDLAGNTSTSSDFVLTVDTSIPTTLAQVTSQTTRDTTPIISGVITAALTNGQYVEVTINGKTYNSMPGGAVVVDPAHNTWYVQMPDTDALTASSTAYAVTAQVKSSAGNGNNANISSGSLTVNAAIDYTPSWTTANKTTAYGLTYGLDTHGMWMVLANQQMMQSTDPLTWSKTALTLVNTGNNYVSSSMADYDRNGTADLFVMRDDYGNSYINGFTNNGDGTFSSAIQVNVGTLLWYGSIVAFDKEGDGYLDFWIGDAGGPDSNTFLLNNAGTLIASSTTNNNASNATTGSVVSGYFSLIEGSGVDLNNDGKIDLVQHTANQGNSFTLSTLINQGNGTFVWGQNTINVFNSGSGSGAVSSAVSMTWADFNGDGYMDLYLPATQGKTTFGSLYLNNKSGVLGNPISIGATGTTFANQFSLAVDWNNDGMMDIVRIAQTGQSYLYTNVGNGSNWTQSAIGSSLSGTTSGVAAMDYDWDGAVDILVTKQSGSTYLIRNTNTVSYGTSLHLHIVDGSGINDYYGNTVQLYNSAGVLVASQIINPQSGMGVNDISAIVNFYGLSASDTYSAVLVNTINNVSSNISSTVNASWGGLKATDATHAYDLSAESGTASSNGKFVGTGYNDTFFATAGTDVYDGSGGWTYTSGTGTWSATGGMDVVDFRLATTGVTVDLSRTTAQTTGFNTSTFVNIEGISGSNFSDTITGNSGDNVLEGRGGNDTFNIGNGGHDTLLYKLINANDATGGNGSDVVNGFTVGTWEGTADTDRIDIRELLQGSSYTGNGKASYVNGVATLDAQVGNITDFVKVTQSGSDTVIQIDRDGTGGTFSPTNVVTLTGVHTDLATLLANHQLMVV